MKKDCYKFTVNHTHNLTPDMGRIINENKHSDFFIMTFICGTLRYPNDEINTLVFVKSAFLAPFKTSDGFYLAWEKLHPNWGNNWIEFGDPIEGQLYYNYEAVPIEKSNVSPFRFRHMGVNESEIPKIVQEATTARQYHRCKNRKIDYKIRSFEF